MKILFLLLALRIIWPPDLTTSIGARCRQIQTTDAEGCNSHMVPGAATWWRVCGSIRYSEFDEKMVLIRTVDSPEHASDLCRDFAKAYYRRMQEELKAR